MEPLITSNPKVMHGTPCFAGRRVAVRTFFDHLEAGYTIDGFLDQFPTVRREQVAGWPSLLANWVHKRQCDINRFTRAASRHLPADD